MSTEMEACDKGDKWTAQKPQCNCNFHNGTALWCSGLDRNTSVSLQGWAKPSWICVIMVISIYHGKILRYACS